MLSLLLALLMLFPFLASGFVTPRLTHVPLTLHFGNKKSQNTAGQGFGKAPPEIKTSSQRPAPVESFLPLQSIETGASDAIPIMPKKIEMDPSMPAEERTKQILREQYGLKSLEEQQTDAKKRAKMEQDRAKREEWKKMAEKEDLDLMSTLPAPLLIAIDRFLKIGVVVCTTLFLASGVGITIQAWSAASHSPLPPDVDTFIVNVIEPNFTPGLFVLLGFSVSLGIFASLQMGSAGAQYKEDK
jgi:hypothetical protein